MHPSNFSVILWDFDGVIINSNPIRELGFREVLKDYPQNQVEELIKFHNENGGWSRYVKFRYFFEKIRGEEITKDQVNHLASAFSKIMVEKLPNKNLLIAETVAFIEKMHLQRKEMHIVSGSDQKELKGLCQRLEISSYFVSINGSPTPKNDLVKTIIHNQNLPEEAFCLIGDAINDWEAADVNGITFFGFGNKELRGIGMGYIDNFDLKIN